MNRREFLGVAALTAVGLVFGKKLMARAAVAGKTAGSAASKPKVLIIGDSISIGYTPHVAEELKDVADVLHNPGNAANTWNGLQKIDSWLGDTRWDVIHFNWGLHDLCYRNPEKKTQAGRDKVGGKLTTSLEDYEANLQKLIDIMRRTGAKLVFATTTVSPPDEIGRFTEDPARYNEAAIKVMKRNNIPVDDLYTPSIEIHAQWGQGNDNVHYKTEGSKQLAKYVAASIRPLL